VHGAAAERVRMSDEGSIERVRCAGVEKGLETAGGAAEVFDCLHVRAKRRHRVECTCGREFFRE
jgi:hypothetical protein